MIPCMAGPGSRLFVSQAPAGGTPDIFFADFDFSLARDADPTDKLTAFVNAGFTNFGEGPLTPPSGTPGSGTRNSLAWMYTVDPTSLSFPANPSGSGHALVWEVYPVSWRPRQTVTAATSANPIVFTVANTAILTQEQYALEGMPGDFAPLNYVNYNIQIINGTTFSLEDSEGNPINGSGFGAYTSGGAVYGTYNDIQPEPFLNIEDQSSAIGTMPADIWVERAILIVEDYTADIGAGAQAFSSTFGTNRDKVDYQSRVTAPTAPYGAPFHDGVQIITYFGHRGVEEFNGRLTPPVSYPTNELFFNVDTGAGADGTGAANDSLVLQPDISHRLSQNLNNTTRKVTPGVLTAIRWHCDTSTGYGAFRAWMKKEGDGTTWTQFMHWVDSRHPDVVALGGATADFVWEIPNTDNQRNGHRQMRIGSVFTGNAIDGGVGDQKMLVYYYAIASSEANLPEYSF